MKEMMTIVGISILIFLIVRWLSQPSLCQEKIIKYVILDDMGMGTGAKEMYEGTIGVSSASGQGRGTSVITPETAGVGTGPGTGVSLRESGLITKRTFTSPEVRSILPIGIPK